MSEALPLRAEAQASGRTGWRFVAPLVERKLTAAFGVEDVLGARREREQLTEAGHSRQAHNELEKPPDQGTGPAIEGRRFLQATCLHAAFRGSLSRINAVDLPAKHAKDAKQWEPDLN